ncbi:MAG TPA: cytochrome c3 family protein [Candidatus Udaeobacter sp.]|nr:cytochrome c3 family protein [Candidatus Udaeobacter sp.]
MAQLFSPKANVHSRLILFLPVFLICFAGFATEKIYWSSFTTYVNVPFEQPVPFSHKHHVAEDGIDCRYCHTSAEKSSFAGVPPTETCMTCHSQIWTDSSMLAPVRASLTTNTPLKWNRVHDLPDFVYFNHSIHISKGIGCSTCHGQIEQMPLTRKVETLYMKWCLDCHRNPQKYVRPPGKIYDMAWEPAEDQHGEGKRLVQEYHIDTSGRLTNCSICHR